MMSRVLAFAAAVCAGVFGPAGLAAADDQESAQEVISKLQAEGYTVTIDRIGTAPIEECVVTNVRNPQQFSQLVPYTGPGRDRGESILVPVIISQPISVSLNCSG
jgi:hypothetical protein